MIKESYGWYTGKALFKLSIILGSITFFMTLGFIATLSMGYFDIYSLLGSFVFLWLTIWTIKKGRGK
jgi:hypothetical protein